MTDRRIDLSSLPSYRAPRRSLFSARKIALMASVVAGLGVGIYGFSPSSGPVDIFSSAAHAQVNNEVRKVAQPVGFADIVERVKPSVISVKVNINEKVAKNDSTENNGDDSPFQPRFFVGGQFKRRSIFPGAGFRSPPAIGPERKPASGQRQRRQQPEQPGMRV